MFKDSFKTLSQTLQASTDVKRLVHKRFVQNGDSAGIFINPCPEICILKAGKFPLLNLSSCGGSNFQWQLFDSTPLWTAEGEPGGVRFSAAELKLPKVTLRNWRWPVSFCIYWWKKTGLARENLWCLWKWKAKSEIPGSNVLLVPWKTPASFTIQEQLVLEKPQVAHRVVVCQHKSIKCSSPAQVKKLRHRKGSVSHTVWPKFMCEKPELFHEIKYWASRQKWNLQTRK